MESQLLRRKIYSNTVTSPMVDSDRQFDDMWGQNFREKVEE